MSRECSLCLRDCPEINDAIDRGESVRAIAAMFGTSKSAVARHKQHRVPKCDVRDTDRAPPIVVDDVDDAIANAEEPLDSTDENNQHTERESTMTTNDAPKDLAAALAEIDALKQSNSELRADFDQLVELLREPREDLAQRRSVGEMIALTPLEVSRQARELRLADERARARAKAQEEERRRAFAGARDPKSAQRAEIATRIGRGDLAAHDDLARLEIGERKQKLVEKLQAGGRINVDAIRFEIAEYDMLLREPDVGRAWLEWLKRKVAEKTGTAVGAST
jgi:hypothetical protein